MSERRLTTVKLHGALGERFGREYRLNITSPAEAMRLLDANFKGDFFRYIRPRYYHVVRGDRLDDGIGLTPEMIQAGLGGETLHILPATKGASFFSGRSKGTVMAVIGVVLIGVAVVASGGTLAAPLAGLGAGTLWGTVASVGVAMALGGVAQLLAPAVPADLTATDKEKSSNSTTRLFNGPVNVTAQGGCVPLVYGRAICGSVVMSAGIHTVRSAFE